MACKTEPLPVTTNKEDELGRKWDRCVTDMLLKLGESSRSILINLCLNYSHAAETAANVVNKCINSSELFYPVYFRFTPFENQFQSK